MSKKSNAIDYDGPVIVVDTSVADELVEEQQIPVDDVPVKPKPGDPEYDWSQHYGDDEVYLHTFPNGVVVGIRSFAAIYNKTWLRKMRKLGTNAEVEFSALDRASCEAASLVLDDLPDDTDVDYLDELFTAWTKSGTSRGDGDEGLTPGN